MEGDKQLNFKIKKVGIRKDEDGDEVNSAVIEKTGPTLGKKKEDILNIIIANRETGISQSELIERLNDEGKSSHQSNVSGDLANLEEKMFSKVKQQLFHYCERLILSLIYLI